MADPKRLALLERLPNSACKLLSIAASFGVGEATILTQDAATVAALKAMDESGALADYDVLVFATHGLVAGETSAVAPGLALMPPALATLQDGGLLTAAEIATLTPHADLVVLSACNTAAGVSVRQEGVVRHRQWLFPCRCKIAAGGALGGLFRGRSAGNNRYFAALKDDPGLTNAAALRRSVLAILDDEATCPFTRHPAYWATFSIIVA